MQTLPTPRASIRPKGVPLTGEPLPTVLVQFMTRIETKLDQMISGHDDHEKRLRALEAQRVPPSVITNAVAIVGVLIALGAVLVAVFKG
jgi:hypothetical protein